MKIVPLDDGAQNFYRFYSQAKYEIRTDSSCRIT
jgi:hypothetical protein